MGYVYRYRKVKDNTVFYVGQVRGEEMDCLIRRDLDHRGENWYVETQPVCEYLNLPYIPTQNELNMLETHYISKYEPPYNKNYQLKHGLCRLVPDSYEELWTLIPEYKETKKLLHKPQICQQLEIRYQQLVLITAIKKCLDKKINTMYDGNHRFRHIPWICFDPGDIPSDIVGLIKKRVPSKKSPNGKFWNLRGRCIKDCFCNRVQFDPNLFSCFDKVKEDAVNNVREFFDEYEWIKTENIVYFYNRQKYQLSDLRNRIRSKAYNKISIRRVVIPVKDMELCPQDPEKEFD